MNLPEALALLVVIVATPLSWVVAFRLWKLSRSSPDLYVLRANAVAALALALIVSVFAGVFLNNGLDYPPLDVFETQVLTRGTLLGLSVITALYWLRLYWDD